MAGRFVLPRQSVFDANGKPLAGAKLYFYTTGTSTPLDTYSDDALTIANANPVVADSSGRIGAVFLKDQDYKVVLKTSADVQIWSDDPVRGAGRPWKQGTDVASAATLTLGDGVFFDVTGTTAITAIATVSVGTLVVLQFDGALTLTHHATDLILPGAANITTAAGDIAVFYEYAAGDWRCLSYQPTALPPTRPVRFAKTATTSGTTVEKTGIPSWVTVIQITLSAVSVSGSDDLILQLGTSGGYTISGYVSNGSNLTDASAVAVDTETTGVLIGSAVTAGTSMYATITITLHDLATNDWLVTVNGFQSNILSVIPGGGQIALAGALDRFRLTSVGGAITFDAGSMGYSYW